jgi:aryl-alcohol dehydrogenase-like predicted oxidoreductase
LQLVGHLRTLAQSKGVTVAQIAIAWVTHRGDDIVPILGSRTRTQLAEALGALDVSLDAA